MRSVAGCIGCFCVLAAFGLVHADDKNQGKKADADNKSGDKLVPMGVLVGRLARVEGAQRYLSVQGSVWRSAGSILSFSPRTT